MAKLGTSENPAIVRVATEEKASAVLKLCDSNGWKVIVGLEPDEPENLSDVHRLLGLQVENTKTIVKKVHVGRNDPCPCGSGKKYKKCCGQ